MLRDDAGVAIGLFSCGTDVTERRQGEVELRKVTADLLERTKTLEQHADALRAGDARTNYALTAAGIGMWELDLTTDQFKWSKLDKSVVWDVEIQPGPYVMLAGPMTRMLGVHGGMSMRPDEPAAATGRQM